MAVAAQTKLATILGKTGLLQPEQIEEIQNRQQGGKSVTDLVVDLGYAREDAFLEKLAGAMGLPYVRLTDSTIDRGALEKLPTNAVFQYNVIPVAVENNVLRVEVTSRHVAELAAELCGPLFARTTGAQIPVDGGNDRVI